MSLALFHQRLSALIEAAPEMSGVTVLDETDTDIVQSAKTALLDPGALVIIRGGDLVPLDGNNTANAIFMAKVPVTLCINESTRADPTWTLSALTDALIRSVHGKVLYETSNYSSSIEAIGAIGVPMDDDGIQTVVVTFEAGVEYLPNN